MPYRLKFWQKLVVSLIVCITAVLIICAVEINTNRTQDTSNNTETQTGVSPTEDEAVEFKIYPFSQAASFEDRIYVSSTIADNSEDIDEFTEIPVDAELFCPTEDGIYYIAESEDGSSEFPYEIRRCGYDGEDDSLVSEYASNVGSPAIVGDYIIAAYYDDGEDAEDNSCICRVRLGSDFPERVASGRYHIYGYDENYIYYVEEEESTSNTLRLKRMNFDGEDVSTVLEYSTNSNSIVVEGDYIFFSAYSQADKCFKIYRSPKNGDGYIDEYVFECPSDSFDVLDGRIYFNAGSDVYSANIDGVDERLLANMDEDNIEAYSFMVAGEYLYYKEAADGAAEKEYDTYYYRVPVEGGEKEYLGAWNEY